MNLRYLSEVVIGTAIEIHSELGPGLLERVYQGVLVDELKHKGLKVEKEVFVPIPYKGRVLDCNCRLDLLVEEQLIIEVKAVERLLPIHSAQAIGYLKLTGKAVALLLNFNVVHMREGGIRRLERRYQSSQGGGEDGRTAIP